MRDFGARGDGETDDTEAFQRALAACSGKVLLVPGGRYRITRVLEIRSSDTVLRGVGPENSILVCPTPLNEIEPNWGATTTGRRTSNYSWSGGIVRVSGTPARETLAEVKSPASRGDVTLSVSSVDRFRVGDELRLELQDDETGSLSSHLYAGDPGPIENLRGRARESFAFRVIEIDVSKGRLRIDRSLRTDVRLSWGPRILSAASSVERVGVEGLGFEFPVTPYEGHFTELGYNALAMSGVRDCWARDLRVTNADSGIFVSGTQVTLERIVLESERRAEAQRSATGHHGITLGGQDNLLRNFEIRTRFLHDVTVTRGSAGNVVVAGRGVDLALDHHRHGPHSNLFTDIDIGEGTRMFQSGGGAALGRHSGAYETFWCVRSRRPQSWPEGWGPDLMNLVGVEGLEPVDPTENGRWVEAIDPSRLSPRDLHRAQLERRLRLRQGE